MTPCANSVFQTLLQGFRFAYPRSWRSEFATLIRKQGTLQFAYDDSRLPNGIRKPAGLQITLLLPGERYFLRTYLPGVPIAEK